MKDITQTPTFQGILQATEHLGPFHQNPKIDKVYRTLRILGVKPKEAQELIIEEIYRRERLTK